MENKGQRSKSDLAASATPKSQAASQRAKRSPGSKFNRILCNLERSILNQFGSHHSNDASGGNRNGSNSNGNRTTSSKQNTAAKVSKPNLTATIISSPSSSLSQTNNVNNTSVISSLPSNGTVLNQPQQNKRFNEQQVQKDPHHGANKDKVTLQPKSETIKSKMTLNKYQQQIVSTMRANQLLVNNKLSIPPPHANDEARNQSHRLLFGGAPASAQSYDTTTLKSVARHTGSKATATADMNSVDVGRNKIDALRPSSSPAASSAKSLPVITTKPGSHSSRAKQNNDDEESGFSTYQSRRSLIANHANNQPSIGELPNNNKSNNMMLMQANQVPMGSVGFNLSPSQQFLYNYQHQMSHSQQPMNAQQHLVASNQVPILSPVEQNNNCYTNTTQLHQMTSPQRHNQSQLSDHQQQQLYGLYGPNGPVQPVSSVDNSQQIYANAPPKPRRYQYYSANQTMFHQAMTPMTNPASTINAVMPMSNGNNAYVLHQQQFEQQGFAQLNQQQQQHQQTKQLIGNQPIYNITYTQLPNLYQHAPIKSGANQMMPQHNGAYIQQRQVNLMHPLTKSKSSLDARDLVRFKHDKQQLDNNTLGVPSQQLIYGSRFDHLNRYPNTVTIQSQQSNSHLAQGNLQRSKSVSHLLTECDPHQMSQQPRDLYFDCGQATIGPKFVAVSSASTTNLNFAGLANNQQMPQQSQFNKISSQLNISQQQRPQKKFHDSILLQSNQLFSAATLRQQQQHQQRMNNWPQYHQASPNCNDFSHQQLRAHQKKANSSFPNSGKIVRQSQSDNSAPDDDPTKSSLDDKIKCLLIGGRDSGDGLLKSSNRNDNVIYHQSNNNNNLPAQSWNGKQVLSMPTERISNGIGLTHDGIVGGGDQNAGTFSNPSTRADNSVISQSYMGDSELTNRIYINESVSKMGNRQHRQYQVTCAEQTDPRAIIRTGENQRKNEANSQLIVDLTTPRVLARTQTTLLPQNSQTTDARKRDSWSINQVGLPQLSSQAIASTKTTISANASVQGQLRSSTSARDLTSQSAADLNLADREKSTNNASPANQAEKPVCERSAPYYYSDLKSEEQRQALLSIVQQKSLSPPPQLLSRSADQSSTRLAPKSATLHPGQARMFGDSLAGNQQQQHMRASMKSDRKPPPHNDFSSISNIAKNIDKLFDSPVQQEDQKTNTVQSMLTLNDCKDTVDSSHLSSFATTSDSISSGYFSSGDMRSRNISKSKSLENISQKSASEVLNSVDRFGNPVYENIRQSDKLMSAINNSTTCLSTSTSRAGRKANHPLENHSDESMDSILGSSLDESDSSLDIIDEIKISPTDDHLTDISQLIEQLKSNHSKLAEEYKATLIRISKTINTKNRNGEHNNEKLLRRIQLLELKSKKCESRSKNQLALIHMMEKVLKQSKLRSSHQGGDGQAQLASVASSLVSVSSSIQPATNRDQLCSSPCLSFDYQNVKQPTAHEVKPSSSQTVLSAVQSPSTNGTSKIDGEKKRNSTQSSTPAVIKAIVTEAKGAEKCFTEVKRSNEVTKAPGGEPSGQVSLSTRHQQNLQQNAKVASVGAQKKSDVSKKVMSIEMRNKQKNDNNPFTSNDDSSSNSTSSNENEPSRTTTTMTNLEKSAKSVTKQNDGDRCDAGNGSDLMRDEEDFIEFLSTKSSSHRSQFEASQFSASDFNTSTSASESSVSGACNDSLNSPVILNPAKHLFTNNGAPTTTTGILKKNSKQGRDSVGMKSIESDNNNKENGDKGPNHGGSRFADEKSSFNNILGNVIDVDICPMNNLSQCSPVNNRASCLN